MSKVRIALVVSHPIQHFCPQYASFARNDKVQFKVFFASALGLKKYYDPNFKKEVSWSNLYLDDFDHVFLNGDVALPSTSAIDSSLLESELEKFDPDVLITYGYIQKLQRRAKNWAIRNSVKIAYIADSELRHRRNWLKDLVKYFFLWNYFKGIDFFLTVGDANEEFYSHYGVHAEKFVRMHFPIDLEYYSSKFKSKEVLRSETRKKYNIEQDALVISVVGKLVSWKNQDHIIDALAFLEKEGCYITLFIIGSGEMMEQWRYKAAQLTRSRVFFTGFVPPEELPSFYSATDIYVHPASVEPHSIAISEAIFMGCPVILSDRCGSYGDTDDVQDGKNGFVYPFGNIMLLAEKIKLLKDGGRRELFGVESHRRALQFQEHSHAMVLTELFRKMKL